MKRLLYIFALVIALISTTSCATSTSVIKKGDDISGYTLKSKKELMQQKIAQKKKKTVLATP